MALYNRINNLDKKFITLQTRKVISAYGGSGSIVETPFGALLIDDFNNWRFFKKDYRTGELVIAEEFFIYDNRLLQRLNHLKGFVKLKEFVHVPENVSSSRRADIPERENETISAHLFPKWFYCNRCHRFRNLKDWWSIWQNVKGSRATKRDFIPPKCGHCFAKYNKKYAPELEQVRFILTSPSGSITDIPWELWTSAEKNFSEDSLEEGTIKLDYKNPCCENQDLRYLKSTKFSDLSGIRIKCVNSGCSKKGREVSLGGLFGLRVFDEYAINAEGKEQKILSKPVIRTSNSVYYPIMVSSIFLPTDKGITLDHQKDIDDYLAEGENIDFIFKALKKNYSIELIQDYIKSKNEDEYQPEVVYRLTEYNFLVNQAKNFYEDFSKNLIFKRETVYKLREWGFEQLIAVRKLKITTVQTGYTRQEPITPDSFFSEIDSTQTLITPRFTSKWGINTQYLPAIESFGEGIFFSFSKDILDDWISISYQNENFKKRVEQLHQNCLSHSYKSVREKFTSQEHLIRFVFIHTLSHLLIKELEFLCGYPSTSLNERLFVDEGQMQGLLIYTIAGAEGSFGGLVSQAREENFSRILKSALFRSTDCASDPICYRTDDGQGVGGLNMAACYSCTLIPENACEEFNSFLDRALLVDQEYGYFRKVLKVKD